ncbi:hypothetical protein SAY87_010081 [Trapa incisa]|uniref:Calcineurin-like phosphoesterase domain-containing protein n=1 Tax=Trapa incisa TaxID=236973 RepID=A0AAN7JHB8_9MYRT|nr:hypothetical protein SAY87_010081 [Trapa incisa]
MGILRPVIVIGFVIFFFVLVGLGIPTSAVGRVAEEQKRVIELEGPVAWAVQLSDLHFSVHHPSRALDFRRLVGPALSSIRPALVLLTGDLTDGKSKDLLTMKQNEKEWIEYESVMEDVIQRSGLDRSVFYDVRGNHDNFGVPAVGGALDFFSKYSVNGRLGRRSNVNSVTLQTGERKLLFVGLDSTMPVGIRGPTNLFGHPSDELLAEIDAQLSQWDSPSWVPVTKISFGHFPLSFTAASESGKTLKEIFLKHSISAYLCGHLHTKFGKNLKRYHHSTSHMLSSSEMFFQLNMQPQASSKTENCSSGTGPEDEFWEWEMGDWRKSRMMRILAIDNGHVSYVDIDFKSGTKETIILPTFPLDSRFMYTSLFERRYACKLMAPASYETIRALVFSTSPVVSVMVRIFDLRGGDFSMVMESLMSMNGNNTYGGVYYSAPWNYRAFEDPSPSRYWLQIVAKDATGRPSFTELRPFSVNGFGAQPTWTWKEFFVMGCQWAALYGPLLWCVLCFLFSLLLIPKVLMHAHKQFTYKHFVDKKSIFIGVAWILQELCNIPAVWFGFLGYLLFLLLVPWFVGHVFTNDGKGYMTYKGWVVEGVSQKEGSFFLGHPDIMVIVIPHLVLVVLPTVLAAAALASEKIHYQERVRATLEKKEDDYSHQHKGPPVKLNSRANRPSKLRFGNRWVRKFLLIVCLGISWKHFSNCMALIKAYEMNPIFHFPGYSFSIPLLLAYTVYHTGRVS